MAEEIKEIQSTLNYYKTIQQEPVYCEELIITGKLQNLLDYITNLQQENEKIKNFITNLISELNHWELNGTKKLDIVSDYIKQEYEKVLKDSDENG